MILIIPTLVLSESSNIKKTGTVPLRSIKPQYLQFAQKDIVYAERKSSAIIKDILICSDHIQNYMANLSFENFARSQ